MSVKLGPSNNGKNKGCHQDKAAEENI